MGPCEWTSVFKASFLIQTHEWWNICHWPCMLTPFHSLFCFPKSVIFEIQSHSNLLFFCHIFPLFCFPCIPYSRLSWGFCCCVCVCFTSVLLFTSVKSEADVHLIKHNTLVINSCLHQLRHIDGGLTLQVASFISAFRENARYPHSMITALPCLQCAHWSHSTLKSLFAFQAPASWINSDLKFNLETAGRKGCIVRSTWKHALVD